MEQPAKFETSTLADVTARAVELQCWAGVDPYLRVGTVASCVEWEAWVIAPVGFTVRYTGGDHRAVASGGDYALACQWALEIMADGFDPCACEGCAELLA